MPGWATAYIQKVTAGETVQFRAYGSSMKGKIGSGKLCTVEPLGDRILEVGDIVLCQVKGREYLHLILAIQGKRYQIGNNRGHINGWVNRGKIFGICTRVQNK